MAESESNSEVQEAELPRDAMTRWFERIFKQWQVIFGLMVAVLILGVLYGYVRETQEEAELAAWKAAAEARSHPDREDLAERLEAVVKKHAGTDALFFIETELMQAYFDSNKPVKARKVAERILREFPDHPFAVQVRADMARLLEYEGKWGEAIAEYDRVLASQQSYLVPEATLGKARCLEQEQKEEPAGILYRMILQQRVWPERVQRAARLRLMAMAPGTTTEEEAAENGDPQSPAILPTVPAGN